MSSLPDPIVDLGRDFFYLNSASFCHFDDLVQLELSNRHYALNNVYDYASSARKNFQFCQGVELGSSSVNFVRKPLNGSEGRMILWSLSSVLNDSEKGPHSVEEFSLA